MSFTERESRTPENRIRFFRWFLVAAFILLASGFWRLQVDQTDYYTRLAERNYIKSLPVPAPRGRILDREGLVLVDNYPSFSVFTQSDASEEFGGHLSAIARGLGLDTGEIQSRVRSAEIRNPYGPVVLLENASPGQIAFVEAHRHEFPELDLMTVPRRLYPSAGFAAHLLGYVGEISERDMDRAEWALLRPDAIVGKTGIERQYDDLLRGEDGYRRVVVNSLGREVAVLDERIPEPGRDLRLSIDYDLQAIAEQSFQGDAGALVALDPRSGEVLAMVSRPSFDPNQFVTGLSQEQWTVMSNNADNPLLNRSIQAQLAPGSVYKIVMAAAALESGAVDPHTSFYCPGGANFYGRYFRCWQRRGHGNVDMHQAIVRSCDVYFYNIGRELGIEKMADFSARIGLGQKTGIDLPDEAEGTLPSPEWKERVYRQKWYPGETISVAIGQGALTVTPLQIAYGVGGIASGGDFLPPRLVPREKWKDSSARRDEGKTRIQVPLSEETVQVVTDAIFGVVNETGGTGARARVRGLDIAGKTGTAQVASLGLAQSGGGGGMDLRDNAWFVGLAPRRNPEIVVSVLYQSGEHGSLAAPIARDVIKAYYEKKQNPGSGSFTMNQKPAQAAAEPKPKPKPKPL